MKKRVKVLKSELFSEHEQPYVTARDVLICEVNKVNRVVQTGSEM